jgi:putative nucleotidyltransferase with HDIG domain
MLAEAGPQVMVAAAHAVDHRNPVAQGHSSRVVAIADAIGRRTGISSSDLESLRAAGFLHDVGHMTLRAGGEGFEVAGHCEEGEKIVAGAKFPEEVVSAVRHHHDRWENGGAEVPLMARILGVVERYEALSAGRACARLAPADALVEIRKGSGTEFDPTVVDALAGAVQDGSLQLNLPEIALPAVALAPGAVAAS